VIDKWEEDSVSWAGASLILEVFKKVNGGGGQNKISVILDFQL